MKMTQSNEKKSHGLIAWRFGIRSLHETRNILYPQTVIARTEAEAISQLKSGYECIYAGQRPVREEEC